MYEGHTLPWRPTATRYLTHDPKTTALSWADRGLLSALFVVCDDHGRFSANERQLAQEIGWFDGLAKLRNGLKRLVDAKRISLYQVDGVTYGAIPEHGELVKLQRSPVAVYPEPPAEGVSTPLATPLGVPLATPLATPLAGGAGDPLDRRENSEERIQKPEAKAGQPAKPRGKAREGTGTRGDASPPAEGVSTPPATPLPTPPAHPPGKGVAKGSDTPLPTPLATPAPTPQPRHPDVERAMDMWLATLATCSPQTLITRDTLERIADETEDDVFCEAVERHIGDDPRWWRMHPIKALKNRIDWTREAIDAANKRGEDKIAARAARGGMSSRPVERVPAPSQPPPPVSPPPPTPIDPDEDRWQEGKRPGWWPTVESQLNAYTRRTLASCISVEDPGQGDVTIYCPDSSLATLLEEAAGVTIRGAVPGRQVVFR